MVIYIDENLSPHLARALHILEEREPRSKRCSVYCIQDKFEKGYKDIELIPIIGSEKAIWITQDKHILKRKAELQLILKHKIGLFILRPYWSRARHWEKVVLIISQWQTIKELGKEKKPFAFRIDGNGKFEKVDRIK